MPRRNRHQLFEPLDLTPEQVLVLRPGTRDEETDLHRQLRPALARGREWYEDGPILASFIEDELVRHGSPDVPDLWSKPKAVVAGKRHR